MRRFGLAAAILVAVWPQAAAARRVCGDGVISAGEPCDWARLRDGCSVNEGCIEQRHRCRCAPSCEIVQPNEAVSEAAAEEAHKRYPKAWVDPKQWVDSWRHIETRLGCSMRDQTSVPEIERQMPDWKDPPSPPPSVRGRKGP